MSVGKARPGRVLLFNKLQQSVLVDALKLFYN